MAAWSACAWLAALASMLVAPAASGQSQPVPAPPAAATQGATPGVPPAPAGIVVALDASDMLARGAVRVLVFSPHPDDATLGAAGLIQRVVRNGGAVRVVEMTSGDAFSKGVAAARPGTPPSAPSYRWYGSLREHESIRAMRQLGVHRSQLRFLGFPDDGLCVLASARRVGDAFESPYTRRASPPEAEQIVPGTMYRGIDLEAELRRIVEEFRPTVVVLPHPGDLHPDHCATELFAREAVAGAVQAGLRPPRVLYYLIHYPAWPPVSASESGGEMGQPAGLRAGGGGRWSTLPLTAEEQAGKRLALARYRSQMLAMHDFIASFERTNELFVEGEPPPSAPCWCAGVNIAGRSSRAQ
jgi:LmbE family N-acetylglucosaminyl deacetylase